MGDLCPVEVETSTDTEDSRLFFLFHKAKYYLHQDAATAAVSYISLDFPDALVLGEYVKSKGHGSVNAVRNAQLKYGLNMFNIPEPTFQELYVQHATAPFFVFQLFCISLWLLDEYWYYSLLTLFMLALFEATVVKRRLAHFADMRSMRASPFNIQVRF
jgi:manganese-transporting P-type ATPase